VGAWLSKSLAYFMNEGGACALTIASRSASSHAVIYEKLTLKPSFIDMDITQVSKFPLSDFDVVVNCATPSTAAGGANNVSQLYKTITEGSTELVNSLTKEDNLVRLVNLSSGAVTMLQSEEPPSDSLACPEDHISTPAGAYSHGKRFSEQVVSKATNEGFISGINLRLYAFAGPGIPLDQHFAAGNFMLNAIQRKRIAINGNPNTVRSYQYPTDLVRSILLAAGGVSTETLEVGSNEHVTMLGLATKISDITTKVSVSQGNTATPISKYYPTKKTISESTITLDEAIKRWWKWIEVSS
jgi:dTDP-glucose 4,6-dehydratase